MFDPFNDIRALAQAIHDLIGTDLGGQARFDHYLLVAEVLPECIVMAPQMVQAELESPRPERFILRQWIKAQLRCRQHGQPTSEDDYPKNQITVERIEHDDQICHVVVLPKPKAQPEAFCVGFVPVVDSNTGQPTFKYYTLELGFERPGNEPTTFFCTWSNRGHAQLWYPEKVYPDPEKFGDAAIEVTQRGQA